LARLLVFIAATIHRTADERRTAEYLLRHRHGVVAGRRAALSLLMAARCAAEMDVRRVRLREIPTPALGINASAEAVMSRVADLSVGATVIRYLHQVTGRRPATPTTRARLLDAVTIAVELGERHARRSGAKPSVLAMRSDARKQARLVTHLRNEFNDDRVARSLARLLVGGDGTSIETSLLWWVAQRDSLPARVPAAIRSRWVRALANADRHASAPRSRGHCRRKDRRVPTAVAERSVAGT
jgi:hypothetical protein